MRTGATGTGPARREREARRTRARRSAEAAASLRTEVLVEVDRGGVVESRHRGALVVVDCQGAEVQVAGDPMDPVFIRSAIKPFVAALLVTQGAADALGLDDRDLAISAASHAGTDEDAAAVTGLLAKAGRSPADLRNPEAMPDDEATRILLGAAGARPDHVRQMCSGEHSGLIVLSAHRGWPVDAYWREDGEAQRAVEDLVRRLSGIPAPERAIDDCGLPTWRLPLVAIARAYGWLATPERMPERLRDLEPGLRRVRDAMLAHPERIGGRGLLDTDLLSTDGEFVAKEGAEGLLGIGSVGTGLGMAVTVEDGDKTRRAAAVATLATLSRLRLLDDADERRLRERHWKPITDPMGRTVGETRPAFRMPDPE